MHIFRLLFLNSVVIFPQIGCNAVSWAPAVVPGSLIDQPTGQKPNYVKRFVSGGCDNLVKLWKYVIVSKISYFSIFKSSVA